jgi:drug/metabolite transporter (DMT)-like permease
LSAAPHPTPAPGLAEGRAPLIGIGLMASTVFCFVLMDTMAKYLMRDYPVPQVVWGRYAFHLAAMVVVLAPRRKLSLRTNRLGLQLFRSMVLLLATVLFFTGLSYLPLADASALIYVSPLLVTALSVPILREHVGPRRWVAVIVGFVGVLVIVRPGAGVMHPATFLVLGTALCFAAYQISTRALSATEKTLTTLFYTALLGAVGTTLALPFFWTPPSPAAWALMAGTGLMGAFGHFLLIKAHERAPVSVLAPYVYTQLIWATIFGYLVFADFPDAWTIVGAGIITGAGLFVFYRESRLARR